MIVYNLNVFIDLTQGHLGKFKFTERKVHNLCPLYTFLMKNYWKSPLHAKIVYNLRVCHDLDPMSFVQGQDHKKCKVSV